jgi:hypothetical protein
VDDDVAHVGQRLERRPLALARGPGELAGWRGLDGAPEDGSGQVNLLDDLAVLGGHSRPSQREYNARLFSTSSHDTAASGGAPGHRIS